MDQLVAPWRIEWVERDTPNPDVDCVFCALPERAADRENRIVARNDHAYVLLNNAPYNPGHVMVIPDAHTGDYTDLTEPQLLAHARLKQRTFDAIREALDPDGFNTGLNLGDGAGGSIDDHLHTHVVPRWEGDTNFMPVTSDTKVVVEAIDDTYERIHAAFAEQDRATADSSEDAVEFA
jgi:ATP adenylyltransferase